MVKAKAKRGKRGEIDQCVTSPSSYSYVLNPSTHGSSTRPRWRAPPPEILWMILQLLATDKRTLRACSQVAREFRHVALSCIGRHLTVNTTSRFKECAQLVTEGAFQHVRSLELGTDDGRPLFEAYWKDYLVILGAFGRYRALDRLWLSEVPFSFSRPNQKKDLRKAIIALGSTVTELGLYGCRFSSYEEMVSLIRSFPLCNFLFIGDCAREKSAVGNAFDGLPKHTLSIKDLQLSSSSSSSRLIDVSNLIEDAALDVGSLTALVCDVETSEKAQRIAAAVAVSTVEQFQVACPESGGFQGGCTHCSISNNDELTLSRSIHGSFVKMDLEVTDNRAAIPQDEHCVLGRGVQRPPPASQRGQRQHPV